MSVPTEIAAPRAPADALPPRLALCAHLAGLALGVALLAASTVAVGGLLQLWCRVPR